MDKNYYDILEVNKNASPEIIKKAYTTLAKKYHPDLQEKEFKKDSEEKLKLINEAYEVLSDEEKRNQYDVQLQQDEIKNEKIIDELLYENMNLKNELNNMKQNINIQSTFTPVSNTSDKNTSDYESKLKYQQELDYQQQVTQARKKAYHDAYIQDLKNKGYRIKYKKTFRDYIKNFIALLLTLFILFLLWQIPFVQRFLISIYNENPIIHTFIDFISKVFNK